VTLLDTCHPSSRPRRTWLGL